jgi:GTP-binding protein
VIRIGAARFAGAAAVPGVFPDRADPVLGVAPEIAFAGRSNVGKSSLINCLCGRKALARTSSTPGRTRQLNFFVVELSARTAVVFVDLPGYGYARVAKSERAAWSPLVDRYLERRGTLAGVVLVVDVRRGIEAEERALLGALRHHGRAAIVVATKGDKLPRGRRMAAVRALAAAAHPAPVVAVSPTTGDGRDELWKAFRDAGWLSASGAAPSA